MAKKSYPEKLQDPRWQKKRLEVFQRDKWRCVRCSADTITLQVHHKEYFSNTDPWEYDFKYLETLCKICHKKEHDLIPEVEYERKYTHLLIYKHVPDVIVTIDTQIAQLEYKLLDSISNDLMEDILKNIIFLKNYKKKLQE